MRTDDFAKRTVKFVHGVVGQNFQKLSAMKKSPMRLMIGPWTHHGDSVDFAGDVAFGPTAGIADFGVLGSLGNIHVGR